MSQRSWYGRLLVLALPIAFFWSANWEISAASTRRQTSEAHPVQSGSTTRGAPHVAAISVGNEFALSQTRQLVQKIRSASFPELKHVEITVEPFHSDVDFFRARFRIPQFFFGRKLQYLLKVNPEAFEFQAPDAGLEAIVAHELGHIVYYAQGNRLKLFGLTRLVSSDFTARFERWADLQAISRGYGESLKTYRLWLYQHVPQNKLEEKRRNYFTPAELDMILSRIRTQPELFNRWLQDVPRNLKEIEAP
jgi:hypothetical protein